MAIFVFHHLLSNSGVQSRIFQRFYSRVWRRAMSFFKSQKWSLFVRVCLKIDLSFKIVKLRQCECPQSIQPRQSSRKVLVQEILGIQNFTLQEGQCSSSDTLVEFLKTSTFHSTSKESLKSWHLSAISPTTLSL